MQFGKMQFFCNICGMGVRRLSKRSCCNYKHKHTAYIYYIGLSYIQHSETAWSSSVALFDHFTCPKGRKEGERNMAIIWCPKYIGSITASYDVPSNLSEEPHSHNYIPKTQPAGPRLSWSVQKWICRYLYHFCGFAPILNERNQTIHFKLIRGSEGSL